MHAAAPGRLLPASHAADRRWLGLRCVVRRPPGGRVGRSHDRGAGSTERLIREQVGSSAAMASASWFPRPQRSGRKTCATLPSATGRPRRTILAGRPIRQDGRRRRARRLSRAAGIGSRIRRSRPQGRNIVPQEMPVPLRDARRANRRHGHPCVDVDDPEALKPVGRPRPRGHVANAEGWPSGLRHRS